MIVGAVIHHGAALRRGWVLLRHRLSKTFLPVDLPPSLDRDAPFGFEFRAREHASHLSGRVTDSPSWLMRPLPQHFLGAEDPMATGSETNGSDQIFGYWFGC